MLGFFGNYAVGNAGYHFVDPIAATASIFGVSILNALDTRFKQYDLIDQQAHSELPAVTVSEIHWNNSLSSLLNQEELSPIASIDELAVCLSVLAEEDRFEYISQNETHFFNLIDNDKSLNLIRDMLAQLDRSNFVNRVIQAKVKPIFANTLTLISEHPDAEAKESFEAALVRLEQQIYADDKITLDRALYLAMRTEQMAKTLSDEELSEEESVEAIVSFSEDTKSYQSSWNWRAVLGAIIGAAIGIVLGAMAGIVAGPMAALTALYSGVEAAMIGASLFGAGGMGCGIGVGLWSSLDAPATDASKKSDPEPYTPISNYTI